MINKPATQAAGTDPSLRPGLLIISIYWKIGPSTRAYFKLLRRAAAFGRGLFCPSGKKRAYYAFLEILGNFWCPIVNLETLSSIKKIKEIQKVYIKIKKTDIENHHKKSEIFKNGKKYQKI